MIDLSDGLATGLGHHCDASGLGVRVDESAVPIAPGATFDDALSSDDYELCFAAADPAAVTSRFAAAGHDPPTRIATITRGQRILVGTDGREGRLPPAGWEHHIP